MQQTAQARGGIERRRQRPPQGKRQNEPGPRHRAGFHYPGEGPERIELGDGFPRGPARQVSEDEQKRGGIVGAHEPLGRRARRGLAREGAAHGPALSSVKTATARKEA